MLARCLADDREQSGGQDLHQADGDRVAPAALWSCTSLVKPPTAEEAIATLVNIAGLDREEDGIMSLQRVIAESLGRDIDEIYANSDKGVLDDVQLLYDINQAVPRCRWGLVRTNRWIRKVACPWCLRPAELPQHWPQGALDYGRSMRRATPRSKAKRSSP